MAISTRSASAPASFSVSRSATTVDSDGSRVEGGPAAEAAAEAGAGAAAEAAAAAECVIMVWLAGRSAALGALRQVDRQGAAGGLEGVERERGDSRSSASSMVSFGGQKDQPFLPPVSREGLQVRSRAVVSAARGGG